MIWRRYSYLFFKIILINAHKTITTTTTPIKVLIVIIIIIIITSHYKLATDAFNCILFSHALRLGNSVTYNLNKHIVNFFNN